MTDIIDLHDDGRAAQELFDSGHSWPRIADELGYPVAAIRQLAAAHRARLDAEAHQHQTTLF